MELEKINIYELEVSLVDCFSEEYSMIMDIYSSR